jgi:alpha-N-acetylglucosaminidase
MLDMFDEVDSLWDKFDDFGYFDTPFIWSVLHNFGGNTGLWGSLAALTRGPIAALRRTSSMAGTGAAPEGIDQNPLYYALLADQHWSSEPLDVAAYVDRWTVTRYGFDSDKAKAAWRLLTGSCYAPETNERIAREREWLSEKNSDAVTGLPLGGNSMNTPTEDWYELGAVVGAWHLLVQAAEEERAAQPWAQDGTKSLAAPLAYDIANTGREALAKHSNLLFKLLKNASLPAAQRLEGGRKLLKLMLDLDDLLNCSPSLMAGPWLRMTETLATDIDPHDAELRASLLVQARSQITTWGPQLVSATRLDSQNNDYANKQWAGAIRFHYAERLKCYLDALQAAAGDETKAKDPFERCAVDRAVRWTNDVDSKLYSLPVEPQGDAAKLSQRLLDEYFPRAATANPAEPEAAMQ